MAKAIACSLFRKCQCRSYRPTPNVCPFFFSPTFRSGRGRWWLMSPSLAAGNGLPNLVNARIRWGSQSLSPSSSSLWSRWQEAIYLSSLCATRQAEGRKQTRLAHIIRDDEICPPLFCSFLSIQLLSLPEFRTDTLLIICDLIKGLQ